MWNRKNKINKSKRRNEDSEAKIKGVNRGRAGKRQNRGRVRGINLLVKNNQVTEMKYAVVVMDN